MKRVRLFPALITVFLLVIAAVGQRAHAGAQDPAYEEGELRVFVCCASGEADLEIRDQINKSFEESHPGVTIKQ